MKHRTAVVICMRYRPQCRNIIFLKKILAGRVSITLVYRNIAIKAFLALVASGSIILHTGKAKRTSWLYDANALGSIFQRTDNDLICPTERPRPGWCTTI